MSKSIPFFFLASAVLLVLLTLLSAVLCLPTTSTPLESVSRQPQHDAISSAAITPPTSSTLPPPTTASPPSLDFWQSLDKVIDQALVVQKLKEIKGFDILIAAKVLQSMKSAPVTESTQQPISNNSFSSTIKAKKPKSSTRVRRPRKQPIKNDFVIPTIEAYSSSGRKRKVRVYGEHQQQQQDNHDLTDLKVVKKLRTIPSSLPPLIINTKFKIVKSSQKNSTSTSTTTITATTLLPPSPPMTAASTIEAEPADAVLVWIPSVEQRQDDDEEELIDIEN